MMQKDGQVESSKMAKTTDGQEGRVWNVEVLAEKIKAITGVLEVGIFYGYALQLAKEVWLGITLTSMRRLTGPQAAAQGAQGGQKPVAFYIGKTEKCILLKLAKLTILCLSRTKRWYSLRISGSSPRNIC